MTGTGSNGWLVPLADLSLILFVITSSGLAGTAIERGAQDERARQVGAAEGVASAIFADSGAQAGAFADWLAQHPPGPGEQLTVLGTYRLPEERAQVAARCDELAAAAQTRRIAPRVIVQQGDAQQVLAYLAHDLLQPVARDLQRPDQ